MPVCANSSILELSDTSEPSNADASPPARSTAPAHACISSWFSFKVLARLPTAWAPAKYSLKAEPIASAAANGANILFIMFLALAAIVFSACSIPDFTPDESTPKVIINASITLAIIFGYIFLFYTLLYYFFAKSFTYYVNSCRKKNNMPCLNQKFYNLSLLIDFLILI